MSGETGGQGLADAYRDKHGTVWANLRKRPDGFPGAFDPTSDCEPLWLAAHTPPALADREGPAGGDEAGVRALSSVLAQHQRLVSTGGCWCGDWPQPEHDVTWMDHVAEAQSVALAAVRAPDAGLRAAKAEALREWIAEWPTTPGDGTFLADVARDGLARAAALAAEDAE